MVELAVRRDGNVVEGSGDLLVVPDEHRRTQGEDVEVRREREDLPRLADAPQVAVDEDQHDADRDEQRGVAGRERGDGAREGGGASGALHRDRHRVVDEERHRRDLRDLRAEVVARNDVGASRRRVEADDVEVGQRHDEQHPEDHEGDRDEEAEGREPDDRRHLREHLLGAVRRGRDAVRCEDAEGDGAAQTLAAELLGDERLAQDPALEPVCSGLGVLHREVVGEGLARRQPGRDRLILNACGHAANLHRLPSARHVGFTAPLPSC